MTNRLCSYGIGDYGIHYWDDDLSEYKERQIDKKINKQIEILKVEIEVLNQARVHIWFESYFGVKLVPFASFRDAMSTHPFTLMCWGVNRDGIYNDQNVQDSLDMVLKYNPTTHIPMDHVIKKMRKWLKKLPELKIDRMSFPKEVEF